MAKLDLFVPKDAREAEDMLCIAVAWLELLTGENSIATEPYRRGLNFLSRNRRTVQQTQKEHKLFVVEFLHMVERCFQKLCIALLETGTGRQPMRRARRELSSFCKDFIRSELGNLPNGGGQPPLSVPDCFASKLQGRMPEDIRPQPLDPNPKGGNHKQEAAWVTQCHGILTTWRVPSGHSYYDYFGKGMEENRARFPILAHHKRKKLAWMCLVYYSTGECKRDFNCAMAHLPIKDMGM